MGGASLLGLFARLMVSMAVVIGLLGIAARVVKRRGGVGFGSRANARRAHLEVVSRQALGRSSAVTIVRAGDRVLILGVTEHQITLLGDGDSSLLPQPDQEGSPRTANERASRPSAPWMSVVETLRERTVRRP